MPFDGLSPRLRGNLEVIRLNHLSAGSIPAPAGEPAQCAANCLPYGVYPRACGGTDPVLSGRRSDPGLSPRLRGNLATVADAKAVTGSIPAPAGEPVFLAIVPSIRMVYPRACGGTAAALPGRLRPSGLSPRLRGNRCPVLPQQNRRRSIPAPAGEPPRGLGARVCPAVYPRACGGTARRRRLKAIWAGLSPRLRGNLPWSVHYWEMAGSIPAPAGEPGVCLTTPGLGWVYPRACGGTLPTETVAITDYGLSPRLRGNRHTGPAIRTPSRSIPAPAGEPSRNVLRALHHQVYPRACGGTRSTATPTNPAWGLSPRLRGNRSATLSSSGVMRSIPAPAGEPGRRPQRHSVSGVYPRACGGTNFTGNIPGQGEGLSPRLRGNPGQLFARRHNVRSIPAPAGEPPPPGSRC